MEIVNWSQPSRTPKLAENEVHIWRAWLDASDSERARLAEFLTEDETTRANRFVFPRDRDHFIVARSRLREILASYIHQSPGSFQFAAAKFGKLSLPDHPHFRFNVSHSHGLALYAVSLNRELGIDAEKIRPEFTGEDIAKRYFSAAEQQELNKVTSAERPLAFFLCWTRKEAYIKAVGDGLQIPLDSFDVSLTPGAPETLRSVDSQKWTLRSFTPAREYAAAVIGEGQFEIAKFYDAEAAPGTDPSAVPASDLL